MNIFGSQNRALKYFCVFLLLFSSGTPLASEYFPLFLSTNFLLILVITIFSKVRISKMRVQYYAVVCISIVLTMLLNLDPSLAYIGYILSLTVGLMFVSLMRVEEFQQIYVRIMTILAVFSLVMYIAGLLQAGFINLLPVFKMETTSQSFGHFFYLQNYGYSEAFMDILLERNLGMFREPGMYQVFLNIALMFSLFRNNNKGKIRTIVILYLTILSTFSTSGILAMFAIILSYLGYSEYKDNKTAKYLKWFTTILMVILIIYALQNYDTFFAKFSLESSSYVSYSDRENGIIRDLDDWLQSPIWGVGTSEYKKIDIGTANSITLCLAQFGILFTAALFYSLYMYIIFILRKMRIYSFSLLALSIGIIICTQTIIFMPIIQVILFYGITNQRVIDTQNLKNLGE